MGNCSTCPFVDIEATMDDCFHVNRPGGITLTREVMSQINLRDGDVIVDAACGYGGSIDYLSQDTGYKTIGFDKSWQMLRRGTFLHPEGPRLQSDSKSIPLRNQCVKVILSECALSLSDNCSRALAEFRRVLEPGGKIIITDVYSLEDWKVKEGLNGTDSYCMGNIRTENEIRRVLGSNHFLVTYWKDHSILLKEWMAKLVFNGGSLKSLYGCLFPIDFSTHRAEGMPRKFPKLGYYAAVAEKMPGW